MSKKYKNKTCVYCSQPGSSETGDHVVAREFFLPEKRSGLPIVPACAVCNNAKSELEHYLTTVLPFGAQHTDASVNLETKVPPRLFKNRRLAEVLRKAWESIDGPSASVATLPLDGQRVERLFKMITRGLAFWHWKLELPETECLVLSSFLTRHGEELFRRFWEMNPREKVAGNLGAGTFVYQGGQAVDDPRLTVWRMSIYGVIVSGDSRAPEEKAMIVFSMTAPRRMKAAGELARLLSSDL